MRYVDKMRYWFYVLVAGSAVLLTAAAVIFSSVIDSLISNRPFFDYFVLNALILAGLGAAVCYFALKQFDSKRIFLRQHVGFLLNLPVWLIGVLLCCLLYRVYNLGILPGLPPTVSNRFESIVFQVLFSLFYLFGVFIGYKIGTSFGLKQCLWIFLGFLLFNFFGRRIAILCFGVAVFSFWYFENRRWVQSIRFIIVGLILLYSYNHLHSLVRAYVQENRVLFFSFIDEKYRDKIDLNSGRDSYFNLQEDVIEKIHGNNSFSRLAFVGWSREVSSDPSFEIDTFTSALIESLPSIFGLKTGRESFERQVELARGVDASQIDDQSPTLIAEGIGNWGVFGGVLIYVTVGVASLCVFCFFDLAQLRVSLRVLMAWLLGVSFWPETELFDLVTSFRVVLLIALAESGVAVIKGAMYARKT